jgi:uncharacterized surface protein with fasciclin (FAS1) repeats
MCISLSLSHTHAHPHFLKRRRLLFYHFSFVMFTAEIACTVPEFSTLCTALKLTGLDIALETGTYTVFAPTDDAFAALPEGVLAGLIDDVDALTDVLLFHAVADVAVTSSDLLCGVVADDNLVTMANGKDSRTVCQMGVPTYQKGAGNGPENLPAIVGPDVFACNGVVHVVDNVLLSASVSGPPAETDPPVVECQTIGTCGAFGFCFYFNSDIVTLLRRMDCILIMLLLSGLQLHHSL